jgi:hypothetical protein
MELPTGISGEKSAKAKSMDVADVIGSEQRRTQLAQMGW